MSTTSTASRPRKGKKKDKKDKKQRKRRSGRTAATSDRHILYEESVQEAECECDLVDQVWRELRGRTCQHIREDFCGTAAVAMEWVKRRRTNTAIGVDIDGSVLDWARSRVSERLASAQARRLTIINSDVLTVRTEPVDSVLAMNFSYYLFKERQTLRRYFRRAYQGLVDDGLFLLDAYGGSDSFTELEEERELEGFTYVWDQQYYNPITGHAVNKIHFRFPDGTEMKDAFSYEWRLWTLPEIQEILEEAGFRDNVVYWEGTDEETNEGNGEWAQAEEGEACPGWVAYLAAQK
ncbi:MAG: class I SAM-dependent methyltransferase [Planctomycetota bacterium]|jgi:cyclopropane fatty-acyl-phospholipid synthase-like methyltransferase